MSDDKVVQGRFNNKREQVWECSCEGQLWYITPAGYRCFKCATLVTFEELEKEEDE